MASIVFCIVGFVALCASAYLYFNQGNSDLKMAFDKMNEAAALAKKASEDASMAVTRGVENKIAIDEINSRIILLNDNTEKLVKMIEDRPKLINKNVRIRHEFIPVEAKKKAAK